MMEGLRIILLDYCIRHGHRTALRSVRDILICAPIMDLVVKKVYESQCK